MQITRPEGASRGALRALFMYPEVSYQLFFILKK